MRLKAYEIGAIKSSAIAAFGKSVIVRLFGSRVRDDLRGGDIDLLIEADAGESEHTRTASFKEHLFDSIDEQKADVVVVVRGEEPSAFARLVSEKAVMLP